MNMQTGDLIFQFFSIGFLALVVGLIVLFYRSIKKRKNQLNRMEEKMNVLHDEIKRKRN